MAVRINGTAAGGITADGVEMVWERSEALRVWMIDLQDSLIGTLKCEHVDGIIFII